MAVQNLTQEEIERGERIKKAKSFAADVVRQCEQQNFTISQFEILVETLDFKRQLLQEHAADITKLGE